MARVSPLPARQNVRMIRTLRLLSATLLVLACARLDAAERTRSTASIGGFESLVLLTGGAAPDDTLPMIIGLHFSSAVPETIEGVFSAIDFPARIVLPRGKYPRPEGYSWFASEYAKLPAAQQKIATFVVLNEISAFIDAAVKRYPTAGRPAIIGISYGGDLSYLIAVHHPQQIAAAFPVAARFPAEWLPESRRCESGCPALLVMHGAVDEIVPVAGAKEAAARLEKLGVPLELREYPEVGHAFPPEMKADFTKKVKELFSAACH